MGVTSFTGASGCGLTGPQKCVALLTCTLRIDCFKLFNFYNYKKSGFARVSNYLTWINTQSFSSKSIENVVDDVSPIKVRISDNLTRLNKTQAPNNATVQVNRSQ